MKVESYATSTIAMSVYNLLAMSKGRHNSTEVFEELKKIQHPEMDRTLFDRAVAELLKRELIFETEKEKYAVKDPQCRLVMQRDTTDGIVDETGKIQGGWGSWKISDPRFGFIPIEEAL